MHYTRPELDFEDHFDQLKYMEGSHMEPNDERIDRQLFTMPNGQIDAQLRAIRV